MPPRSRRSPLISPLLKYPLFILIAFALAAALAWHFTPGGPKPDEPPLTAQLSTSLLAFYKNPLSGRDEAVAKIRAYRRSFPGATRDELMDPAYVLTCNIPPECTANKQRQDSWRDDVEATTVRQFSHLPRYSPEFHAALTNAYATDLRLPVSIAIGRIYEYPRLHDRERELLKLQADFFRIIDQILQPEKFNFVRADWEYTATVYQYTDLYLQKTLETLKPIPFSCNNTAYQRQRDFYAYIPDTDADCSAAVAEYDRWEKQHMEEFRTIARTKPYPYGDRPFLRRMLLEKIAAFKKLLTERRARRDYIRKKAESSFLGPYVLN